MATTTMIMIAGTGAITTGIATQMITVAGTRIIPGPGLTGAIAIPIGTVIATQAGMRPVIAADAQAKTVRIILPQDPVVIRDLVGTPTVRP